MNKAFAVQWDMGGGSPIAYRVWFPISKNGNHLSDLLYATEALAQAAANRWNAKHGIR